MAIMGHIQNMSLIRRCYNVKVKSMKYVLVSYTSLASVAPIDFEVPGGPKPREPTMFTSHRMPFLWERCRIIDLWRCQRGTISIHGYVLSGHSLIRCPCYIDTCHGRSCPLRTKGTLVRFTRPVHFIRNQHKLRPGVWQKDISSRNNGGGRLTGSHRPVITMLEHGCHPTVKKEQIILFFLDDALEFWPFSAKSKEFLYFFLYFCLL